MDDQMVIHVFQARRKLCASSGHGPNQGDKMRKMEKDLINGYADEGLQVRVKPAPPARFTMGLILIRSNLSRNELANK